MPTTRRPPPPIRIDLALQGGGSHGAFTWGVLDRLLEDESLGFDGVSGTSAGALNAAVLATGWAEGGRRGAQAALRAFWLDVAGASHCFGGQTAYTGPPWLAPMLPAVNLDWNPAYLWFKELTRWLSPYQFNPLGLDPLRRVVERHVRPPSIARAPLQVFVTATAVRSGRPRVFAGGDVTIDALLASACLPQLFKAVQIDGQAYWDGGFSGNPALWPLIYETRSLDLLLVKVNPLLRPDLPDSAAEIADRTSEITFNAGLISELRAIAFVQKLVREGKLGAGQYKNLRLHMVAEEKVLAALHPSSKLNTAREFLLELHALGRAAADRWWQAHRRDLGKRPSLDVRATFLEPAER